MANRNGNRDNHTHLKKRSTCELLVRLIYKEQVPDSTYLRSSAKRVTVNQRYKEKLRSKIEKDKNRTRYININKGVRK